MAVNEIDTQLEVLLLGSCQATVGPESIRFPRERRFQLLAYLALAADWVGRDRLAYLFWSDRPQQAARRNLRKVLHTTRALPWLRGFESSNRGERWRVVSDVDAFRRAYEAGDWQAALAHHRGPLLWGLDGGGSEFDLWLAVERERLQADWRQALLCRAEELRRNGRSQDATRLLKTLLEYDEFDEHALQRYMNAAVGGGDRDAALRAYHEFSSRLADQLEIEPAASLQRLARAIERGEVAAVSASPAVSPAGPAGAAVDPGDASGPVVAALSPVSEAELLPTVATTFVGRARERAELARLLARPGCRLLSVVGPGGVGKTRLVLEVARDLAERFRDGARFVPLDTLGAPAAVPARIAASLGIELEGGDPVAQLVHALGERQLLLVLDNYEQLLAGAPVVADLLRACPGLWLLVTSRERLDLREEWVMLLEGLTIPADAVAPEEAERYDAVQLFAERARQLSPDFSLEPDTLPHVLDICRLLDGSPLAIELAASWVRLMGCDEIAREIATDLDFLTTSSRNVRARHRSLRATFEHSWQLLAPKERDALRRLSVFRGGFTAAAARHVVGAPLPILASLVDASVLRVSAAGRYDRHPLVHQYTREALAHDSEREAEALQRHAEYYAEQVSRRKGLVRTGRHQQIRRELAREQDNLLAMWDWAVRQRHEGMIDKTLRDLMAHLSECGLKREVVELLERAAEAIPDATPLRVVIRNRQGAVLLSLGRWREARSRLEDAVRVGNPNAAPLERAITRMQLGRIADMTGAYDDAQRLWETCLRIFRQLDNPIAISEITHALGLVAHHRGAWRTAVRLQEESLAIKQRIDYLPGIAVGNLLLADVHLDRGDLDAAEGAYRASARAYGTLGNELGAAEAAQGMAVLALRRSDPDTARQHLQVCLPVFERRSNRPRLVEAFIASGDLEALEGRAREARDRYLEALRVARETELTPLVLLALGRLIVSSDLPPGRRLAFLRYVSGHAACRAGVRLEVEAPVAALAVRLSPDEIRAAHAAVPALGLAAVCRETVASFGAEPERAG